MIYLFYALAAILIFYSFRSFLGGIRYLRHFREALAKPRSDHTPRATVFVPCRGVDPGMLGNFDAILDQDYPEYEVIFIVDDSCDPAAELIESSWRESVRQVKLVVAPLSKDSGQKVENLREGVLHADASSEIFVFVDSDATPDRGLIRSLAAPLADQKVGVSTGYRWFVSSGLSFASEMRSVWNASVASAIGDSAEASFCWGGAMAITRETFERLNVRERWSGTLSDDFAAARIVKGSGLRIQFVPLAMTPSYGNCTFRELIEFTNRQMKLTRVYAQELWIASFFGSGLFLAVFTTAIVLVAGSDGSDRVPFVAALVTLILVALLNIGKTTLRLAALRMVLPVGTRRQYFFHNILWGINPVLYFANCTAALFSRTIRWRGTLYRMDSPSETVVIAPGDDIANL